MADPGASEPAGWTVIVPVKRLRLAKTRLGGEPAARAALALGMATDVVSVALACPGVGAVLVVTEDPVADRTLRSLPGADHAPGVRVVGGEPGDGLSAAVSHAARVAAGLDPFAPLAVLMSDLPALRPADLAVALGASDGLPRAVAADISGRGTVLLAVAPGVHLDPAYEGGSLAAHLSTGAVDISAVVGPRMRRDVDTAADLVAAVSLGVGPATAAALAAWQTAGWVA